MNFRQLGLIDPILKALAEQGYQDPTPIQRDAIPPALAGRDVLGCAQTGTGKTCAFAAPILQRLFKMGRPKGPRPIRALILTPTRELAIQIQESFLAYGKNLPLRSAVIFGGVSQKPQVDQLKRGVDILVATPGRLLDLHGQKLLDLSRIEIFVLDEADRMLDMGFIHDVRRVLKVLPQHKQTLFFSATMPPEVMELVDGLLHDYAQVAVDPVSSAVEVIRQSLYHVDKNNKTRLLAHLIKEKQMDSVLVFCRTKHGANRIARDLGKQGITAAAIHGNKSQTARQQALSDFKNNRITALVATDIAARGIDIDALKWVVNYDLPEVAETYVHRIGRTGRAGRDGSAIAFCRADEMAYLKQIEKLLGRRLEVVADHPFPMAEAPTGVDPMIQARRESREAARAAKAERLAQAQPAPQPVQPAPVPQEKPAPKQGKKKGKKQEKAAAQPPVQPVQAPPVPEELPPAKQEKTGWKKWGKKQEKPAAQPPVEPVQPAPIPQEKPAPKQGKKKGNKQEKPAAQAAAQTVQPPAQPPRREEVPHKKNKRGMRHGDLSAMQPAQPLEPVADFVKPNPLDSDVILDATARLLAPRKPIYSNRSSWEEEERKESKRRKEIEKAKYHRKTRSSYTVQPTSLWKLEKELGIRQPEEVKLPEPEPVEPPQPEMATAASVAAILKKKRSGSRRPMSREHIERMEVTQASRQKDSTENAGSVMKPYYISYDD